MKRLSKQIIGGLFLAVAVMLAPATLFAVDGDHCVVNSKLWTLHAPPGQLTIPRAMNYANARVGSGISACRKSVTIKVDSPIDILNPIPIRAPAGSDESSRFELIGETAANGGFVVLNADALRSDARCAVIVYGNYVRIKNIRIIGVPDGVTAVCVEGNYAEMDGLQINSGANGLVAETNAKAVTIKPNTQIQSIDNYGIQFKNTSSLSQNRIIPTDGTVGATDTNGFAEITGESNRITMETVGQGPEDYIVTENPVHIQIHEVTIADEDRPYILVRGAVINTVEGIDVNDCSAPIYRAVDKIQIYRAGGTTSGDEVVKGGFHGYVGRITDVGFGLGDASDSKGFFQVRFPIDDPTTPAQVIFVPEITGGYVGKPSKVINIIDDPYQRHCERDWADQAGTPPGRDGDGDSGTPTPARFVGYKNVAECLRNKPTPSSRVVTSLTYDSDGDGLKDVEEDINKNCDCDSMETCWYKPDTDDDGIPDGMGNEKNCITRDDVATTGTDAWILPARCPDRTWDPDDDGYANAVDPDSDNDGRQDYQEDRNFYYVQNAGGTAPTQGILHRFRSVLGAIRYEEDGRYKEAVCDLREMQQVGVRYAWYIVDYKADGHTVAGVPQPVGEGFFPEDELPAAVASKMELLVCRNQLLFSTANFNGHTERGNIETDPTIPDTDADGWCDGNNEPDRGVGRCPTYVPSPLPPEGYTYRGINDRCPTVKDPTNTCATLPCTDDSNQVLFGVHPLYVHFEGGVPAGFRDSGQLEGYPEDGSVAGDGIPDVLQIKTNDKIDFQRIKIMCFSDIDSDGIPDCVEHPNLSGSCNEADPDTHLLFTKSDTDGDGFGDGYASGENSDVCPGERGDNDNFVQGAALSRYRCETSRVYDADKARAVACFIDRDSDGLRDCEEDKDLSGEANPAIRGLDGIGKTETNPLSKDTDGDTIFDKKEVYGSDGWTIPTNAADMDTDKDGINDNEEDSDGNGRITFAIRATGEEGCSQAMFTDTNPANPDTDGDELNDNIETDGNLIVGQRFVDMLMQPDFWSSSNTNLVSDPTVVDSDGDGKTDAQETPGGVLGYSGSNPCMKDSDLDSVFDNEDFCPLNPNGADAATCGEGGAIGADNDGDDLTNTCEDILGTDPNERDTDGDTLFDGQEDSNKNCQFEPMLGESNPKVKDTDSDGLADNIEDKLGTNANNIDSDGDCIPDGPMTITNPDGEVVNSRGEDTNKNGEFDPGSETDPNSPDTDGDGLLDGNNYSGLGEDMNCNGIRDRDANGLWLETDPRNPDSDYDGHNDREEICHDGRCDILTNMNRATTGRGGCSMMPTAGANPIGMIFLIGSLVVMVVNRSRCLRKR